MEPISFYTLEGSMEPISYYNPDNWPKKTDAQVDSLISTSEARGLKILDRKDRVHVRNAKKVFRKSRKLSAKRGCSVVFLGKALKVDTKALIIGRYKYVFTLWFAN